MSMYLKKSVSSLILLILLFCSPVYAKITLSASKAKYFDSNSIHNTPNSHGIYPVEIQINDTEYTSESIYSIFRTDDSLLDFELIGTTKPGEKFFYDFTTTEAGKKYTYKVLCTKSNEFSDTTKGWGALCHELYFITYNKIIIISHNRLTLMNKPNNMDKIGKEQIDGLVSGTLSYKTKVQLTTLSGIVIMHYENYSDNPDWIITGNMDTKANIAGRGSMSNFVEIKGMYPGKVYYDNVLIRESKAGGGTYGVEPSGLNRKDLDYTWTFKKEY